MGYKLSYILLFLIFQTIYSKTLDEDSYFDDDGDFEVVYLPSSLTTSAVNRRDVDDGLIFNFTAFGRSIPLNLKPNYNLIAPSFKLVVDNEEFADKNNLFDGVCHFLHEDGKNVAAFDFCRSNAVHGIIISDDSVLEITPIAGKNVNNRDLDNTFDDSIPHAVKRMINNKNVFQDDALPFNLDMDVIKNREIEEKRATHLIIEVSVFFDEAAYKIFGPFLHNSEKKILDMLLAYMNGVQALYHHSSLGRSVEIVIIHLEIMKHQPHDFPHYDGERSKLLDSFCAYQQKKNPHGDSNPGHWDMALLVSGLDFYAIENGRKSGVTMGLATVGGVCLEQYACVIAELGTTNVFGKPYPSAGFTSVYILAHEIGHNLGMHHDSSGNSCSKEGYIMSPSRGTSGETQWSQCSADVMHNLGHARCLTDRPKILSHFDHSKFLDVPGQHFSAKKQCEFLLRDNHAVVSPNQKLSDICNNLQCKTPRRSGYYYAGPALEGTDCGRGLWCQGGYCVKMTAHKPVKVTPGGWGPWKAEQCHSGCISKSKGAQSRHRACDHPKPVNTDEGCDGSSYDRILCNDDNICRKRSTSQQYASEKCKEFSKLISELDPKGGGLQAPHEAARPWMGCAIFCRRADSGTYYTPRIELNDVKLSPYFPDGTWCHSDSSGQYYCLQNHCLPEHFKFTKTSLLHGIGEDVPIPQNAYPSQKVPAELQSYLSLGPDGKPLQTSLLPNQIKPYNEVDWETQDYVDLPASLKQEASSNDDFSRNFIDDEPYLEK